MIPLKAIKLAEKGGWQISGDFLVTGQWEFAALDKTFWQALIAATCDPAKTSRAWWKTKALEFYKLILTNGDTEKFWKEILT